VANDYNPFLIYLETHPGADAAALKQLFRMLAKRTHPDLGAENEAEFVQLQDAYNQAMATLLSRSGAPPDRRSNTSVWFPAEPREQVLHFLYRYKAHLPSLSLDSTQLPIACKHAFENALEAAGRYTDECRYALTHFKEQFHDNRTTLLRYPEVVTKYRPLMQGVASFFDYCVMPNRFNRRLTNSFLGEIRPVTDFDPNGPPEVRTNRSAAARSALYRMRVWLEHEIDEGPCRVL
jgi:hypothetical protein